MKSLPNDLVILPAHTSQAVEFDDMMIAENLSGLAGQTELVNMQEQQFLEAIIDRIPQTPANYLQIAAINKAG